ncbi:MAG: hypothetical protein ACREX4_13500 [Gammaproteobacteria bacterium]
MKRFGILVLALTLAGCGLIEYRPGELERGLVAGAAGWNNSQREALQHQYRMLENQQHQTPPYYTLQATPKLECQWVDKGYTLVWECES